MRAAFEGEQLRVQLRMIEQLAPPRVQERQQLAVGVGLRRRRLLDRDAVPREDFDGPLACVAVALDRRHPVRLEHLRVLGRDLLGGERRPALAHVVEHGDALPLALLDVRDGDRERILPATTRVREAEVTSALYGLEPPPARDRRGLDHLAAHERL